MKYVVDKNNDDVSLVSYKVNMTGLKVHPRNNSSSISIKSKEVILVDSTLRSNYIKKVINKRIDRVINFMMHILGSDDNNDSDGAMVLDEVNRLKGIIIKKYREYMNEEEYKNTLNKLMIIEDEFNKNYNRKIYSSYANNIYYDEGYRSERSR